MDDAGGDDTGGRWTRHERPLRLRYGCHLYPQVSDDAKSPWLVALPDGQFIRLRIDARMAAALATIIVGGQPPARVLAEFADGDTICTLLDRLAAQGLLEPEPTASRPLPRPWHVAVCGASPLATAVTALLRHGEVERVEMVDTTIPHIPPQAIIACADWLPDRQWQLLDEWCLARAIPWQLAYAEGDHFCVGPFVLSARGPTYADVRARRLASAPFADELASHWRWLETAEPAVPVRWPDVAALALLAGAVVAPVLAHLAGEPPPLADEQLVFTPAALAWSRHPILPLPRDLLLAGDR